MKNNHWVSEETRAFVTSRLPRSPAQDYVRPEINRIATTIKGEDDFFPKNTDSEGRSEIFAKIEGDLKIGAGESAVVDCGFDFSLPPGYRMSVSSSIQGLFLSLLDSKRLKVSVFNSSEELVLHDRQMIGKIWIEPIYFFDWIRG